MHAHYLQDDNGKHIQLKINMKIKTIVHDVRSDFFYDTVHTKGVTSYRGRHCEHIFTP